MSRRTQSFIVLIGLSFEHAVRVLFNPFRFKKWLILVFVALLAGQLIGGCGPGIPGPGTSVESWGASEAGISRAGNADTGPGLKDLVDNARSGLLNIIGYFVPMGFFIILFILLIMWLNARFKFVWYHDIATNQAAVREPFKQYAKEGNALFLFNVIFGAVILVTFIAWLYVVYALASQRGFFKEDSLWTLDMFFSVLIAPVFLFAGGLLAAWIFSVFVDDFIVPILAVDQGGVLKAIRSFAGVLKRSIWDFCLYLVIKFVLGFIAMCFAMILGLLWIFLDMILAVLVFGLPYLFFAHFLGLKFLFWIVSAIMALPFACFSMSGVLFILLMCAVFFRSFSLHFLSSLGTKYVPIPLPQTDPTPAP